MNSKNNALVLQISLMISYIIKKIGLLALCLVISGVGFDIFKTLTYQPQYMASMQAALKSSQNTYSQLEQTETYTKTLQYIFNGQVVKNEIKSKLNLETVNMNCQIVSQSGQNIVTIQVIAPTKKEAYYSLKCIKDWYQNNGEKYHLTYELNVLQDITLNESPIAINSHFRNFRSGVLYCGILLLVLIGFIVYFRQDIKKASDIEKMLDCRLFAKIPRERKKMRRRKTAVLMTSLTTSFYYKEAIKKLRNRFELSAKKHGYQTIMITSTVENEGKSTVAANLALSLARSHYKVLLIDGDLKKPAVHKIFSITKDTTINRYFSKEATWQSQVNFLENYQLSVLCADQDLNLDEKVLETQLAQLIKEAKSQFDYIIIDAAPTLGLDEPLVINRLVDASFLVVKQNEATISHINEVISRLVQAKNNLIGCIYNASIYEMNQGSMVYGYRYGYNHYNRKREVR